MIVEDLFWNNLIVEEIKSLITLSCIYYHWLLQSFKDWDTWEFLAAVFILKTTTPQTMIFKFSENYSGWFHAKDGSRQSRELTVNLLLENHLSFDFYKKARRATDVIFHWCLRPAGTVPENKKFYSGKYSL